MILISIEKGNTNVNLEKSSFFVLFERDNAFPNSVLMGARRNNKQTFELTLSFRTISEALTTVSI